MAATTQILTLASALRVLDIDPPVDASDEQLHHMLCVEYERLRATVALSPVTSPAHARVRDRLRTEQTMIQSVLRAHGLGLYKAAAV